MEKRPVPLNFILVIAYLGVVVSLFHLVYGVPVERFTYLNMFLHTKIDTVLAVFFLVYALRQDREYRKTKIALLCLFALQLATEAFWFSRMAGLTPKEWEYASEHLSRGDHFIRHYLTSIHNWAITLWLAWSFVTLKPFYIKYPSMNTFQVVFLRLAAFLDIGLFLVRMVFLVLYTRLLGYL